MVRGLAVVTTGIVLRLLGNRIIYISAWCRYRGFLWGTKFILWKIGTVQYLWRCKLGGVVFLIY